jgi:L-Ala-D/L-Glu epimerase
MHVELVELHRVRIPLKTAFKHARAERSHSEAVIVVLGSEEGSQGFGEILPRPYVTGETIDGVFRESAPRIAKELLGLRFSDRGEVLAWIRSALDRSAAELAAFGGFELALLDLAGKRLGFSLGEVIGTSWGPELPAGIVIGFEIATAGLAKHCAFLRLSARRHIKVKVGLDDDRERLEIISKALAGVPLRLDANGEWSPDRAIAAIRSFHDLPIASVEQPVAKDDLEGLRRVREETGVKVMADESVSSLADAERLVASRSADIFNVRIGKHGGAIGARRIVDFAEVHGIAVNLGTLVGETGILSRAAEVFGRFVPGFECLDGRGQNEHLLEEDLLDDPREARHADPMAHGLGVRVSRERLEKHSLEQKELR